MGLDAANEAAMRAPVTWQFHAVEILWPGEPERVPMRLTDGGTVAFAVNGTERLFTGRHETFGQIASLSPIRDGADRSVTRFDVGLHVPSGGVLASLANPATQYSPVRAWHGSIDPATGLVNGDPRELFVGLLDRPRVLNIGEQRVLLIQCGTEEALALASNAYATQSTVHHQAAFPGELGFANKTNVTRRKFWRRDSPRGAVSSGGGSSGGGGGLGGGGNVNIVRL